MPFEGSTLQCDARKTPQCDVGQSEAPEGVCPLCHLPPISPFTDPSALRAPSPSPDVRLGSLTLMRHKMTFSHFSKGFIRPNLGEESGCGLTYRFQVSGTPLLCPSESGGRGAKLRRGYVSPLIRSPFFFTYPLRFARPPNLEGQSGGMPNGKRKCENGKLKAEVRK